MNGWYFFFPISSFSRLAGVGNIRRRRQGAAVFLIENIRFLFGDKDLRAGVRCPFELTLKDGFSLSFSRIFCQRLLGLEKGEDKAKQSGLSSRRLLLILNLVCLSTIKKGFAQSLVALGYHNRSGFFHRTKIL